jgi:hypothetical protein
MTKSISSIASKLVKETMATVNKDEQLQSTIHPELNFYKNSMNLLIGRRGSGKTYNVTYELIKLSQLPGYGGYTAFVIISDKENDSTINECLKHIKLKVVQCNYDNAMKTLGDIIEGKTAYDQVIENNLEDRLTDKSKEDILLRTSDRAFYDTIPHTAILMDDAINIFKRKGYTKLHDLLFRNRQPRFTIFICAQDPYSIPVTIRRNLDSLWLFGGFQDRSMFMKLLSQFSPGRDNKEDTWEEYHELGVHDAMQFNIRSTGIEIVVIYSNIEDDTCSDESTDDDY